MKAKFNVDTWTQVFSGIKFKGIGFARIKGESGTNIAYSKWVKIARMNHEQHTVTTIEPFGDSADMDTILGGSPEYFLEIKDAVVENRPEFDGRFFVKVFKDATLAKFVMQQTDDTKEYFTTYSFKHSYISSTRNNPGASGDHAGLSWNAEGGNSHFTSTADVTSGDPQSVNRMAKCSNATTKSSHLPTKRFWKDHGTNGFVATWFLDGANFLKGGKSGKQDIGNNNGIGSWNGIPNAMLSFGVNRQGQPNDGDDGQFRQLMTTPGTFFRFRNDPNQVVYEVKGSADRGDMRNGPRLSSCKNCFGDHNGWKHRRGFKTYFTQAQNPNAGINTSVFDPRGSMKHTGGEAAYIDIVEPNYTYADNIRFTEGNAIWETEPKDDVGLDLYYEASNALPVNLTHETAEWFAPKLSSITVIRPGEGTVFICNDPIVHAITRDVVAIRDKTSNGIYPFLVSIGDILKFTHNDGTVTSSKVLDHYVPITTYHSKYAPSESGQISITFGGGTTATFADGTNPPANFDNDGNYNYTGVAVWEVIVNDQDKHVPGTFITDIGTGTVTFNRSITDTRGGTEQEDCTVKEVTGCYKLDPRTYLYSTELGWHNCYSFGNGLESDRIRDDFNAPMIDNGVKVSTTLDTYGEERRGSGMIWSGIYNSTSGINELNEFNMAEPITKDLNPSYGTLQALKTRDTNVVAFCEDKVFRILANKDALFNADGTSNVTASNAVLGDAKAFVGDYGISSNPESLAVDSYRMYFTDKQRGKVLRLSQDGLTPISDVGMTSWFRKHLNPTWQLVGSFDEVKGEYNVSLQHTPDYLAWSGRKGDIAPDLVTNDYVNTTLSFNERSKGWVSFKSFIPETGLSINGEYLTGAKGTSGIGVWSHHDETVAANNFYGTQYNSTIDILFNDNPSVIKGFATINYEGSQARVVQDTGDNQYYNLNNISGWYVSSIETDQQQGNVQEFINKEGKWFNNVFGEETTIDNYSTTLDTSEFSVQGLGTPSDTSFTTPPNVTITIIEDGE